MTAPAPVEPRQAFGLRLWPEIGLPVALPAATADGPEVRVELGRVRAPRSATPVWRPTIDGRRVVVGRCPAGELDVRFGDEAAFRIARGGDTVTCAPHRGSESSAWHRFLLDTVLWSVALVRGRVAVHAAAVAVRGSVVAIVGGTGAGKTTTAIALLRRGAELVSDDVLVLSPDDRHVMAHPAPPTLNADRDVDPAALADVGPLIARLGDERWVAVRRAVPGPLPLGAVIVLRRAPGPTGMRRQPPPDGVLTLEAHSVSLPGLPRIHAQRRFEVLADVAARVPVVELEVARAAAPDAVAGVVLDCVALVGREVA